MNHAWIVSLVLAIDIAAPAARAQAGTQRDSSAPAPSNIRKLEELTWPQIDALDRERTMFILPVGMIEEHGPQRSLDARGPHVA